MTLNYQNYRVPPTSNVWANTAPNTDDNCHLFVLLSCKTKINH